MDQRHVALKIAPDGRVVEVSTAEDLEDEGIGGLSMRIVDIADDAAASREERAAQIERILREAFARTN